MDLPEKIAEIRWNQDHPGEYAAKYGEDARIDSLMERAGLREGD